MSVDAVAWALRWAPVVNAQEHVLLIALADRADEFGRAAWPYQDDLAARGRCSIRTARRHLSAMEKRGLISRGDQRLVAHLRSDRRPIVWDLDLSKRLSATPLVSVEDDAPDAREDNLSPRAESVVSTSAERPDNMTGRTNGVPDTPDDRPDNMTGRTELWSNDRTQLCPPIRTERPSSDHLGGVTHVAREADNPQPPRCPDHVNHPNPPACGGCADARREWERQEADRKRRALKADVERRHQEAADRGREIDDCNLCDSAGYFGTRVCTHDPEEVDRAKRGVAMARAALIRKDAS